MHHEKTNGCDAKWKFSDVLSTTLIYSSNTKQEIEFYDLHFFFLILSLIQLLMDLLQNKIFPLVPINIQILTDI